MKKIFAFVLAALALVSCKMDFYRSDTMTSSQIKENPSAAYYTTDGIYAMFKDLIAYKGEDDPYPNGRNQYMRHYFQITELRSDNVTVSGVTSDPFIHPYDYADIPTEENIYYPWWIGYKIIYAANSNISVIEAGKSAATDQLLGENYFFRGLLHFQLVSLFAMPYVCGRDNPGIILHVGMDSYSGNETRASVGQVYDAVVKDLEKAIEYLSAGAPRGNHSYVSTDAAKALLARVYLYMENNEKCIEVCNDLLGNVPAAVTSGYDFADYPKHTYDMDETIWCVRMDMTDNILVDHPNSTIGSMYYSDGNQGWGEHYWSDELIELFQRYPEDKRFEAYFKMKDLRTTGTKMITFAIKTKDTNTNCSSAVIHDLTANEDGSYDFTYNKKAYKAVPEVVNTYTQYFVDGVDFVTGKTGAGERSRVYVRPDVGECSASGDPITLDYDEEGKQIALNGVRNNGGKYVIYYNTKFTGKADQPMLSSPVFLRWGEVVLNRAEAYAKTHQDQKALDDVEIIRKRAGLTGDAKMTLANYQERGYESVLDVVLDERRMELCFEGQRYFDVFRNRRKMDRRFVGFHEWGFIDYTDKRLALLIPLDEINSSHIEQNPR